MTNQEIRRTARNMMGCFNEPLATRDLPASRQAMTFITLPTGKIVKLSGFAHERQVATVTRKHLRGLAAVTVAHVIVERGSDIVIETRATFVDCESGIGRRAI